MDLFKPTLIRWNTSKHIYFIDLSLTISPFTSAFYCQLLTSITYLLLTYYIITCTLLLLFSSEQPQNNCTFENDHLWGSGNLHCMHRWGPQTDHGGGYLYGALYWMCWAGDRFCSCDACMNGPSEPPDIRSTKKQTRSLSHTSQQRWTELSLRSIVSHSHVVIFCFHVFSICVRWSTEISVPWLALCPATGSRDWAPVCYWTAVEGTQTGQSPSQQNPWRVTGRKACDVCLLLLLGFCVCILS